MKRLGQKRGRVGEGFRKDGKWSEMETGKKNGGQRKNGEGERGRREEEGERDLVRKEK